MFFRTESFKQFTRYYPVITAIVSINFILWFTTDILLFKELEWLGRGSNHQIAQGQYWRLVTPIFFHAGLMHVLFNSFSLVLFGPALEQMLGKGKFIITYLGTGIVANLATFLIGPAMYFHLGASGAVFGLFGVYLFMVLYRKQLIDQDSAKIITTILIVGLIMTFIRPNINILGHLFGFIGGFALAPIVLHGARPFSPYRNIRQRKGSGSDNDIAFDPDRWKKRRVPWKKWVRYVLWGVIILLVALALFSRFLF